MERRVVTILGGLQRRHHPNIDGIIRCAFLRPLARKRRRTWFSCRNCSGSGVLWQCLPYPYKNSNILSGGKSLAGCGGYVQTYRCRTLLALAGVRSSVLTKLRICFNPHSWTVCSLTSLDAEWMYLLTVERDLPVLPSSVQAKEKIRDQISMGQSFMETEGELQHVE